MLIDYGPPQVFTTIDPATGKDEWMIDYVEFIVVLHCHFNIGWKHEPIACIFAVQQGFLTWFQTMIIQGP